MTTLVRTRQALETLSMGNAPERRQSKRLAGMFMMRRARSFGLLIEEVGAVEFEEDDDFQFVRKSKRPRTEETEPVKKAGGRGRPPKTKVPAPDPIAEDEETSVTTTKKPTRRKATAESHQDESQPKVPKRGATRRGARQTEDDEQPDEQVTTNGATRLSKGRKGRSANEAFESPAVEESTHGSKIALPMSDTPIINRNKEMRKKGAAGNRRSSLGSRGRRASSLIDSGQTALPHREVRPAEFYKHIEAEGLPEPRRMKQLLTWCGERALSEKPAHGTKNSSTVHGGTWASSRRFDGD